VGGGCDLRLRCHGFRSSRSRSQDNLEAWLVTAVGRVALNMLRSRRTRREEPLDAHLPDPIVDRADGIDPEHEVRGCDLFEFTGDKIARKDSYWKLVDR